MLIALSWRVGFKLFTFIVNNLIQYEHLKIHLICELKRALYGIKCVHFLTNMVEHIVEEKQILRFVNTGFRVTH